MCYLEKLLREQKMYLEKFNTIAQDIEHKISKGIYEQKIPTVRSLASSYSISTKTAQKALMVLKEKNLIYSQGTQGMMVNRGRVIRPKTNIVGIFSNFNKVNTETDPVLSSLKSLMAKDGYQALFINSTDPNIFKNKNFWNNNWVDGYIFVYSSFNLHHADILRRHYIPFVIANRQDDNSNTHWVDFNLEKTLRYSIDYLLKAGRKKLIFAVGSGHPKNYKEIWNRVTKKLPSDCSANFYQSDKNDNQIDSDNEKLIECCAELQIDGLIVNGFSPLKLENKFNKMGIHKNKDYSLISRTVRLHADKDFPQIISPYEELPKNLWSLFQEVLKNPDIPPQHRLIDEKFNF
jgi:DNA-binding transcriptional regulator YhcF (GntR family)